MLRGRAAAHRKDLNMENDAACGEEHDRVVYWAGSGVPRSARCQRCGIWMPLSEEEKAIRPRWRPLGFDEGDFLADRDQDQHE